MKQLLIQVRKDLKLLSTDARFIFLIVVLAAIAFIIAVQSCSSYVNSAKGSTIVTSASLIIQQKVNLGQYWTMLLAIDSAIFTVAGALAMTAEKDTGMLRYILTSGCDKKRFFASKFIVLLMMVLIAVAVSLVAYLIAFAMMDMPSLGADTLFASMMFPLIILLVFAAIGLFLATVSKKKAVPIILAIFLFFLVTMMFNLSLTLGANEAYRANPHVGANNATEFIPPLFLAMDLANPMILTQGTYLSMGVVPNDFASVYNPVPYDLTGGAILGLAMMLVFVAIGYAAFRTERLDKVGDSGIIGRILGR
ncbi:MAG TPA: ABC transporter permease subunit [Methanomassiliicoccales archaeon]|jgi:ABC-type transport system involved in multi-copper enzyme maturation permease subunit